MFYFPCDSCLLCIPQLTFLMIFSSAHPLVPGKTTLSIYGQHQLQGRSLLVHLDTIIIGRKCEAEKVNVPTFQQHSVVLNMFCF